MVIHLRNLLFLMLTFAATRSIAAAHSAIPANDSFISTVLPTTEPSKSPSTITVNDPANKAQPQTQEDDKDYSDYAEAPFQESYREKPTQGACVQMMIDSFDQEHQMKKLIAAHKKSVPFLSWANARKKTNSLIKALSYETYIGMITAGVTNIFLGKPEEYKAKELGGLESMMGEAQMSNWQGLNPYALNPEEEMQLGDRFENREEKFFNSSFYKNLKTVTLGARSALRLFHNNPLSYIVPQDILSRMPLPNISLNAFFYSYLKSMVGQNLMGYINIAHPKIGCLLEGLNATSTVLYFADECVNYQTTMQQLKNSFGHNSENYLIARCFLFSDLMQKGINLYSSTAKFALSLKRVFTGATFGALNGAIDFGHYEVINPVVKFLLKPAISFLGFKLTRVDIASISLITAPFVPELIKSLKNAHKGFKEMAEAQQNLERFKGQRVNPHRAHENSFEHQTSQQIDPTMSLSPEMASKAATT